MASFTTEHFPMKYTYFYTCIYGSTSINKIIAIGHKTYFIDLIPEY